MRIIKLLFIFLVFYTSCFSQSKIETGGLNNRGSSNILGVLYNASSWTSGTFASDWSANGCNASLTGTQIQLGAITNGQVNESLDIVAYGNSCLEYWRTFLRYKTNTATSSTSFGLGVGSRSSNTVVPSSVYAYVDLSTGAGILYIINTYNGLTILGQSTGTPLTYTNGDSIDVTLERIGNQFFATGRNKTTNSAVIKTSGQISTVYASPAPNLANTGHFAVFTLGPSSGTTSYIIDSVNVFSKEIKYPDVAYVGDSKTVGYFATFSNRWATILKNNFSSSIVLAGGGDKGIDVFHRIGEIINSHTKAVLLEIGTNDSDSTILKANIISIDSACKANSITCYHTCMYTSGNLWRWNFLLRTFPGYTIDTYTPLQQTGALATDNVHPSDYGDTLISNAVVSSGKISGGKSFFNNFFPPSAAGGSYINNSSSLQSSANFNIDGSGQLGSILLTAPGSGVNHKIYNGNTVAGYAQTYFYPASGTNVNSAFVIIPKGTGQSGNIAGFTIFGTDFIADGTNFNYAGFQQTGSSADLLTSSAGTGTTQPWRIYTGTNTGQFVLTTAGNITSTGNLTLSALGATNYNTLLGGNLVNQVITAGNILWGVNVKFDGTNYRFITTNPASYLQTVAGATYVQTSASGTAGNILTPTTVAAFFNSGNVGIGTATDNATDKLQVSGSVNISSLTASLPVFTNASKQLVSNSITGSGSVVMSASPALTGVPTVPTATKGTSTTQAASTAFVLAQSDNLSYAHTIFTPTTGGTVALVNHQYNIINPAGALVALTVNLPSSPVDGDVVYIKYTQTVSTVTYGNGTVVDGITAPTAGGLVILLYNGSTTSWY